MASVDLVAVLNPFDTNIRVHFNKLWTRARSFGCGRGARATGCLEDLHGPSFVVRQMLLCVRWSIPGA